MLDRVQPVLAATCCVEQQMGDDRRRTPPRRGGLLRVMANAQECECHREQQAVGVGTVTQALQRLWAKAPAATT